MRKAPGGHANLNNYGWSMKIFSLGVPEEYQSIGHLKHEHNRIQQAMAKEGLQCCFCRSTSFGCRRAFLHQTNLDFRHLYALLVIMGNSGLQNDHNDRKHKGNRTRKMKSTRTRKTERAQLHRNLDPLTPSRLAEKEEELHSCQNLETLT